MKPTRKRLFSFCGALLVAVAVFVVAHRARLAAVPEGFREVAPTNLGVQIVSQQSPPFTVHTAAPIYVRTGNHSLPLIGDALTVRGEMHDSARFIKVEGLPSQSPNYILQIRSGAHVTPTPLFPRDGYYITGPVLFCIPESLPSTSRLTKVVCDDNKDIEFRVFERSNSQ